MTPVRFCSLTMLLVFAFNTASLLLVYLGWLFAQCFDQMLLNKRKPQKGTVLQFAFLFCFPFVFWLLKNLFFSPHGDQEHYNSLVFDPAVIIYLFLKVPEMFLRLFIWELKLSYENISITIILITLFFVLINTSLSEHYKRVANYNGVGLEIKICFIFFLIIFAATTLPYNLVQKGFGFRTKSGPPKFLVAAPAITLAVISMNALFKDNLKFNVLFLSVVLAMSTVTTLNRHIDYQIRAIKDHSLGYPP